MSATVYDAVLTGAGATIKQCSSVDYSANNQVTAGRMSGAIDPSALYLGSSEPRARWTSADLAGVLTAFSPSTGFHETAGIKLPYRRRSPGSTYAGATSHTIISATKGLIVPTRFGWEGNAPASIDLEVGFLSSDGLASPVTVTNDQTLASQTFSGLWRGGPAFITPDDTPVQLLGVTGITVNPGIAVVMESFDGAVFPINAYIQARNPTIDVSFLDEEQLATFGPLISTAAAFVCYFRKMDEGSTVVADETEAHIAVSFADALVDVQSFSASENETGRPMIRIVGEALTVSTASAIS